MSIWAKSKGKSELVAVFDIGSSSVGGALLEMNKSGAPKIIYSIREPILLEENINADRFLFLTLKSFDFVANKIATLGLGAPKNFFCVLSSPWYASQIRTISLQKNTPFLFTSKFADTLIAKEVALFEEQHLVKNINVPNKTRIIELKNIETILNGYSTPEPIGQKAKELEMIIFVSIGGEQILLKMEEVVAKHFHSKDIKFSSFVLTSFAVVRDLFADKKDFLLVDISGEVTDISIVKNGILRGSVSYPLGHNFMIRGVASLLRSTLSNAKSFISLYKDGHAEASTVKKLDKILGKLRTEWLKSFQESLVGLSNDISIPSTVFVTADQDLADFFSETIKAEQFNQYTLTDSKFEVTFLSTAVLAGTVFFGENVARDPFLIIESIYINRLFH